eukprot:CAMPEP_0194776476 /NCGR_PEP_ID=MMETSP0323_2-20130528/63194_1 /TAXON_ID=2866 ORGANISM="Crypthecodinium cohnii, Strain Seligo" /NCGR_SAMPLE_ID=MMETSP0323_2 /ASSEMBLY_ACC=CAM_ASM_000346 /LENGTH=116 /DNA_ID=CAMNT_0039712903 /DNA_START=40 /DNA_END=391 /DNA_ORIENTATION=-
MAQMRHALKQKEVQGQKMQQQATGSWQQSQRPEDTGRTNAWSQGDLCRRGGEPPEGPTSRPARELAAPPGQGQLRSSVLTDLPSMAEQDQHPREGQRLQDQKELTWRLFEEEEEES